MMHTTHTVYNLIKKSVLIFFLYPYSGLFANVDTLFSTDEVIRLELRSDFSEIQKDRIETPEDHASELVYYNPDGSEVKLPLMMRKEQFFLLKKDVQYWAMK